MIFNFEDFCTISSIGDQYCLLAAAPTTQEVPQALSTTPESGVVYRGLFYAIPSVGISTCRSAWVSHVGQHCLSVYTSMIILESNKTAPGSLNLSTLELHERTGKLYFLCANHARIFSFHKDHTKSCRC